MPQLNTANIELSRELYSLSGWKDTLCWWNVFKPYEDGRPHYLVDTYRHQSTDQHIPAYDLGYLVRKLPATSQWRQFDWEEFIPIIMGVSNHDGFWTVGYMEEVEGDTPEDAACELLIEMFKTGKLKTYTASDNAGRMLSRAQASTPVLGEQSI